MLGLKLAHLLNVVELEEDEGTIRVALAVDQSEHLVSFLPAVLPSQPARRFGHDHHGKEQQDCWNHLHTPRDAKDLLNTPISTIRDVSKRGRSRPSAHDQLFVQETLTAVLYVCGVSPPTNEAPYET